MDKMLLLFGSIEVLLVIFMQWQVYIKKTIITFSISSFFMASFLLYIGMNTKEPVVIYVALLTLLVRVIFIPYFMIKKLKKEKWRARETQPTFGIASSIIFSILSAVVGYFVYYVSLYDDLQIRSGAVLLSLMFQGVFLMISKRNAFTQLVGYMIMENSILIFGTYFYPGLSLTIEAGVVLDLIGVVMISSLIGRLRENFVPDSLENSEELKG